MTSSNLKYKYFITGLILIIFSLSFNNGVVYGYEISVHRRLSQAGFNDSILNTTEYLSLLGIHRNQALNGKSPSQWIEEGSRFEDGEPPGSLSNRPLNHFYDPITKHGLLNLPNFIATDAVNWGLESQPCDFIHPGCGTLTQEWSIIDARDYFYKGLTETDPIQREDNLAKTFRALGQVIHLVQDMAQPQHVRSDPHLSFNENNDIAINWNFSRYEAYTGNNLASLNLVGYPIVNFNHYPSFWTENGRGLADFTNSNFISEDTNFNQFAQGATDGNHPSPALNLNDLTALFLEDLSPRLMDAHGVYLEGGAFFFGNSFIDYYTGTVGHNDRMTTYSYFDRNLIKNGFGAVFSLNRLNFDNQAAILLPRAVGYSAGLINYFFRGKLLIKGGVIDDARTMVKLKVINQTEDEIAGSGVLRVVAHYNVPDATGNIPDNPEEFSLVSQEVAVGSLVNVNEETQAQFIPFTFDAPISEDATNISYTVAFRGQLGAEEGAVIGQVYKPDPKYVFIEQTSVSLNSNFIEYSLTCDGDCPNGNLNSIEERVGVRKIWPRTNQVLSGKFVSHGDIQEIRLQYGTLFINDQEIPDNRWNSGDTPEPPDTWRIEFQNATTIPGYLTVTLKGGAVFTLTPAYYINVENEGYKEWGFQDFSTVLPFIYTRSYAKLETGASSFETPDYFIGSHDLFELEQIGGYGFGDAFSESNHDEGIFDTSYHYDYFTQKSRGINLKSYSYEESFFCDLCGYQVYGDLFDLKDTPDPAELNITGRYKRIYPQEELDFLADQGIEPEDYTLSWGP